MTKPLGTVILESHGWRLAAVFIKKKNTKKRNMFKDAATIDTNTQLCPPAQWKTRILSTNIGRCEHKPGPLVLS